MRGSVVRSSASAGPYQLMYCPFCVQVFRSKVHECEASYVSVQPDGWTRLDGEHGWTRLDGEHWIEQVVPSIVLRQLHASTSTWVPSWAATIAAFWPGSPVSGRAFVLACVCDERLHHAALEVLHLTTTERWGPTKAERHHLVLLDLARAVGIEVP